MAYQPAVLGMARLGNFRLGYRSAALAAVRRTRVRIMLAGVLANTLTAARRVRTSGLTIRDVLNDAPNACDLTVQGTAPTVGMDLFITIDSDDPKTLFSGTLQTVVMTYDGKPTHLSYRCTGIDDSARANRYRPFGTWVDVSATTIAQYLITTFAPGFTSTHVQASLPTVSIIFDGSETFMAAVSRLANLIGGYCYVENLDLHLFTTEATDAPDDIDDTPGRFLDEPSIAVTTDLSQVRTRVYGKGHGEAVIGDVLAGETIIPLANAVMFNASGGQAMAGTTPDGAQSQILDYTGVQLGGVGSLVGPSVAPSVAPALTVMGGAGLSVGAYEYAYTWVTAAGESLPSPLGLISTGGLGPAPAPTLYNAVTTGGSIGAGTYLYAVTFTNASGETATGATYQITVGPTNTNNIALNIPIGPSGTTARTLYRTTAGGSTLKNAGGFTDNTSIIWGDVLADASLGATAAAATQVAITGVAIGPSGTTARKIYRTVADGAQLKLQQTIANNTATAGVQDATADGSLSTNAPTSDTSGLTLASGQVNAGSTSLLLSGVGPFAAGGGWVLLGSQVVRYTGLTGNTLTGIPATGTGAITTTVVYGDSAIASPALTGVTGLTLAMQSGTPVHIWVQRDDLDAQAAMIAIDAAQGRTSDGVIEYVITDARRGEASLTALCDADLALHAYALTTITYASRDLKTKSGKPVVFNVTTPAISTTLTIQDVQISEIDVSPGVGPRYAVTASSVRVSLEDLLRQLLAKAA